MHQGNPLLGPSEQQDSLLSGPSSDTNSPITRPFSRTLPHTSNYPQKDSVKQPKQSFIPTLKHLASSGHSPATNLPINNCPKSTSCIPISQSKLLPRPSDHSNKPMPHSQNKYVNTITRSSMLTPNEIFNFLTYLIAMNSHSAVTVDIEKPNAETIPESSPYFSAPTKSNEFSESSEPSSESQKSISSSPYGTDTDSTSSDDTQSTTIQTSTASNRTLRSILPINYNETLLRCLCRRPQIRTLHNVSIPFPDSNDEET